MKLRPIPTINGLHHVQTRERTDLRVLPFRRDKSPDPRMARVMQLPACEGAATASREVKRRDSAGDEQRRVRLSFNAAGATPRGHAVLKTRPTAPRSKESSAGENRQTTSAAKVSKFELVGWKRRSAFAQRSCGGAIHPSIQFDLSRLQTPAPSVVPRW